MENRSKISEHAIQAGFYQEACFEFRNDPTFRPVLFFAVLNGAWIAGEGNRKGALIQKYKAEGWKPGIADIHYDQPRGPFSKLVIEFKRESKRKEGIRSGIITGGLDPDQVEYLQAIRPYARIVIAYTTDEALKAFRHYMSLEEPGQTVMDQVMRIEMNKKESEFLDQITGVMEDISRAAQIPQKLFKNIK